MRLVFVPRSNSNCHSICTLHQLLGQLSVEGEGVVLIDLAGSHMGQIVLPARVSPFLAVSVAQGSSQMVACPLVVNGVELVSSRF